MKTLKFTHSHSEVNQLSLSHPVPIIEPPPATKVIQFLKVTLGRIPQSDTLIIHTVSSLICTGNYALKNSRVCKVPLSFRNKGASQASP